MSALGKKAACWMFKKAGMCPSSRSWHDVLKKSGRWHIKDIVIVKINNSGCFSLETEFNQYLRQKIINEMLKFP